MLPESMSTALNSQIGHLCLSGMHAFTQHENRRRGRSTDLQCRSGLQPAAGLRLEPPCYSPEEQPEDVQGRCLDEPPLRNGDLDRLFKPSQEAESLPSQLPPQNTEAEMAGQDPGHRSPGLDRNPRHPRHAEASATARERPPGENGRRVTTQTTFLRSCC
ncbi:unnamed protein product [Schistocephalus solidus]|uniref:Uncharacterized protein n=1 Tax=Schistocephalus solidus TaxID=70667 RepID=A0A183TFZ2_SCHSO|nr:unnamed protein product [Schistocephalus solidus]